MPCPPHYDARVLSCVGTTIESGDGVTHFVPIIEGCPLHQSITQMDVAGQDITLYLMQLLSQKGNSLLGTGRELYCWPDTPAPALISFLACSTYGLSF